MAIGATGSFNQTNTWYHLVGTWDGTDNIYGQKIYVDGAFNGQGTMAYTTLLDAYDIRMGSDGFNGYIDEARIYNRALSAAEIKALYEGTK